MSATLELTQELIRRRSITPLDEGCQELLVARLEALGFHIERLPFAEVSNFWARRGTAKPLFAFAGHTDVVPPGPLEAWQSDPFEPVIRDGFLYGRGAADMKGSLAAMVSACERFIAGCPDPRGSIGFLVTSDEEGLARDGTAKVIEWLQAHGEIIDYCLVGEPSSKEQLGDVIKNGRRGSLHGTLRIQGVQGHVAYPDQVRNPIHAAGPIIARLAAEVWDQGNEYFPPTSLQISNIHAGTGADNVVPGELELIFNLRFSPAVDIDTLQERVQRLVANTLTTGTRAELSWRLSGQPFLTRPGELVAAAQTAIGAELGIEPALSTSGGTSDGRFIAPTGAQVVELGPVNATIHQIDERVQVSDLERLSCVYERILQALLG
jgi:succinyl-diaminopimelate desuccinylase